MSNFAFLVVAIVAEVVATSLLKASHGFTRLWPVVGSVAFYLVAFYFLSLALRTIHVGAAYAIWSGVGIAFISLVGWLVFGERFDGPLLAGLALITAGVIIINVFSKAAAH
ncbi:MAG: SMR family transporter [Sorangiineae bacterium]|nr:SMR family transporter [Polyangiaceae bacterium]MEB2321292.1 SMR family transporter [Sorangiineae bacterium]